MNSNKNITNNNNKKNTQKITGVIYDSNNITEVIKLLNMIKVEGIEQCAIMTNIAQRLNSFVKQEEMEVEV